MLALLFIAVLLLSALVVKHDPSRVNFISALIGAGASLIGGAMNRNAQKKANEANRPVNQVREWEEAGINPIFGISSGGYIPHQAASMGDAFAQAGGQLARGFELQHQERLKQTELRKENQKLRETLDDMSQPRQAGYMQQYGAILPLTDPENPSADTRLYSDSAGSGPSPFAQHQDVIPKPKRDVYNLYVDVYDPKTDRWVSIPNPDLMDVGPLEGTYSMGMISGADVIQNDFHYGGVGGATQPKPPKRPKLRARKVPDSYLKNPFVSERFLLPFSD